MVGPSKQASIHFRNTVTLVWGSLRLAANIYPVRACANGLLKQSVCLSVCPVKNFEISTFKELLYTAVTWQSKKIMYVYLIETKAVHSFAFPF